MARRLPFFLVAAASLRRAVLAQQAGKLQPEKHLDLWVEMDCTADGCKRQRGELVIDSNWRWVQSGGRNCYTQENKWDPKFCSDPLECAKQCSVEGANYEATYGVTSDSGSTGVNLKFVTRTQYGTNYGSRLYLMDSEDTYLMFKLKNREFSFDVDASNLPCGTNGAVYFVEMDRHGDLDGAGNTAGAKYGTGYCDAQCPHDMKFIKGEANVLDWNHTADPPYGHFGICCAEMDIWEANSMATAYTPHTCTNPGSTRCEGIDCGDTLKGERYKGICDKDGCDFNPYRMGNRSYYGVGSDFTVDTSGPISVVTQFLTKDDTDEGELFEVRRFYVQDGKVIPNSEAIILGPDGGNSITDDFCKTSKAMFGDLNDFAKKGGMREMGAAMDRGMVLALSLWDDTQVNMLWLDSRYPLDEPRTKPGVMRGPCPGGKFSTPAYLRENHPDSNVVYSAIKFGKINSTFGDGTRGGRRLTSAFLGRPQ